MKYTVDILLVTIAEVETIATLKVFRAHLKREATPRSVGDKTYHDIGSVNGAKVWLVQAEMGSGGLGASQQTITKAITALSPRAIVMVGIAFGVDRKKQAIGEVLVSQRLRLYDLQRAGTRGKKLHLILRGDRPHASVWLYDRCRSAKLSWKEAPVDFGLILTGEKLVDNLGVRDQLVRLEPEAIGGEMESGGLYVASHDAKVDWILVKAICDWGDGHKLVKKKERQQIAARNAASFVLHMIQFCPFEVRTRQRRRSSRKTNNAGSNTRNSNEDTTGNVVTAGAGGVAVGGNVHGGIRMNRLRLQSRRRTSV